MTRTKSSIASKSRVNLAGETLRLRRLGLTRLSAEQYGGELEIVGQFRAAHAGPLTRVASNLRYYVSDESDDTSIVGQRLKRLATILDKLTRQPKMNLARMHDIGGCRAVLPTQAAVDRVIERLMVQRRWEFRGNVYDYVAAPKSDGYRAKHLVVVKDGMLIEIQLRTEAQHRWAELVERFDREHGLGLKTGRAEPWARELFALGSRLLEMQERGELAPSAMMEALQRLARRVDRP